MTHFSLSPPPLLPPVNVSGRSPRPRAGLSTDLYCPPLPDLLERLSHGPPVEYLELFRGRTCDLEEARRSIPEEIPLAYHGDCLWYTQADFASNPAYREEERRARGHMEALGSPWMIHECAQKAMEGFAFGLYAPPLLTEEGVTAARFGALHLQGQMGGRLLLLETPPFPPHPPGPMDLGDFFHRLTLNTPLGIGLDLGHCLTYLGVSGYPVTPESLVKWLKEGFPLERVVEIHVGGLARRRVPGGSFLIDDHSEPVPDLLFDCLEATLGELSLPALAGVALEVDNKGLPQISREFQRFAMIVDRKARPGGAPLPPASQDSPTPLDPEVETRLRSKYRKLARELSESPDSPYRRHVYPEEIWLFGGAMPDLFPETLALLEGKGIDARTSFVTFFNSHPRSLSAPMDFLEIKLLRALEWIDILSRGRETDLDIAREVARKEAHPILSDQSLFNGDPL